MTKRVFMLLSAAALFVCGTAIGWAEELSPEAQLCKTKKDGLATLEAEAPGLHAKVAKLEAEYAAAEAVETNAITGATEGIRTGMGGDFGVGLDVGRFGFVDAARKNREAKRRELDSVKERERHVGSQIFLLRDIIAGLGCGAPTPAPVDFRAIDQHTQQYQQSQPGSQATTSGQSVQPQGSYATPSSGFGASSGSTQPAGQQGQQPGYGPGPDTGSPQVPYGPILEGIQGSIGDKAGGKPAGG
jgi:hypothetical protein